MSPSVDPYQWSTLGTSPELSPGKSIPVRLPKPKRAIQLERLFLPSSRDSVIAPTFDEWDRISRTVSRSVRRGSASWMTLSATWIEYGSVNGVLGVTTCSESAPATVTSLKVEAGSEGAVTARFLCRATGAPLFAS